MQYLRNIERIEKLVKKQNNWRQETINLIASENVMSKRAREIMGSDFCHRYAEGHPGERYYQGTEIIDEIEARIKLHLKSLFNCKNIDVRPISGTIANDAVFSRYINYNDIVMVNSTSGGGHISHHKHGSVGKYTSNIINFPLTEDGYHIDVDETVKILKKIPVKVMIMGKSLYLFLDPVKELAPVCKKLGITLIYDAAHVLGLIAGKAIRNPLNEGADIVNGSTHKTFYGSQRGIRIGVPEMTRFGMKENEMGTIAELIKKCLIDGKYVGNDVIDFRKDYQVVHYSFDHDYLKLAGTDSKDEVVGKIEKIVQNQ